MPFPQHRITLRGIGRFNLPNFPPIGIGQVFTVKGLQIAYANPLRYRLILQTVTDDVFISEREQVTNNDYSLAADTLGTGGNVPVFYLYHQKALYAVAANAGQIIVVQEEVYDLP